MLCVSVQTFDMGPRGEGRQRSNTLCRMVVVVAVSWRRPTLLAISAEPPGGERASITAPSLSPEPSGEPDTAKLRMYHLEKIRTGDKLQGGEEKKP